MIIYNITVRADLDIHEDWLHWLRDTHLPRFMQTGLFCSYRISHLLDQDENDGFTYVIQLTLDSLNHYHTFKKSHEMVLNGHMEARYGNACTAFRTLMQVID